MFLKKTKNKKLGSSVTLKVMQLTGAQGVQLFLNYESAAQLLREWLGNLGLRPPDSGQQRTRHGTWQLPESPEVSAFPEPHSDFGRSLSATPKEPEFWRLSPDDWGSPEPPNLLRPWGSMPARGPPRARPQAPCPHNQAQEVTPEPETPGPRSRERKARSSPEAGRTQSGSRARRNNGRFFRGTRALLGVTANLRSSSSCPPEPQARPAPIGQQSQPSANTLSSSSFGRRWLKEQHSHWLVLRKLTRRDYARGGLVQLVKTYVRQFAFSPGREERKSVLPLLI